MARGLRSNRLKKNNTKLRAKVFGPVIDERTKRLSSRLAELSSAPRPDRDMVDNTEAVATENPIDTDVQATEDPSAEGMYMASKPCLDYPAPASSTALSGPCGHPHESLQPSVQLADFTAQPSYDTRNYSQVYYAQALHDAEEEANNSDSGISMTLDEDESDDEDFLSFLSSATGFANLLTSTSDNALFLSAENPISTPSQSLYLALGLTNEHGPSLLSDHNATFCLSQT